MGNGLETFRLIIGGKAVDAVSGKTFQSQNPYPGQPWAELADGGPEDVDLAVQSARSAFEGEWGPRPASSAPRSCASRRRDLGQRRAAGAAGGPRLRQGDAGDARPAQGPGNWYLYISGLADKLEGKTVPAMAPQTYFGYTVREPVGVVAAITPWNSPLLLLTWKLAPVLAAGCTCVAKPSEHSPASAAASAEVLYEAGLPAGVFNVVTGLSRETGAALAGHPGVDKIAFTGSAATGLGGQGRRRQRQLGHPSSWGGKSPQVVFPTPPWTRPPNGVVAGVFAATGRPAWPARG